jgi:hypothetical protein
VRCSRAPRPTIWSRSPRRRRHASGASSIGAANRPQWRACLVPSGAARSASGS